MAVEQFDESTAIARVLTALDFSAVSLPKPMSSDQHPWPMSAGMARSPGVSQGQRLAEQFNLSPIDTTYDDHTDVQVTNPHSRPWFRPA